MPKLNLTAFWKWFWFALSAVVLKGPQAVELVSAAFGTSVYLPTFVHVSSFVLGLAGLLLTLHINPTPKPSTTPALPIVGAALLMLAVTVLLVAYSEGCGATVPQVVNGETTALDLTQAACSVADTTGDAVVIFGCELATLGLNTAVQVTELFEAVPASQAVAFAAAHPETAASRALVPAYHAIHPAAVVGALR